MTGIKIRSNGKRKELRQTLQDKIHRVLFIDEREKEERFGNEAILFCPD
jgi:hypothetical protein